MGDNSTALISSLVACVAVGYIFFGTIKIMDLTGAAAAITVENSSSSTSVEKTDHETNVAEDEKASGESESESDADEYEDDEESDEDLEVEIKNSYGVTDGPFKMVLCINMSLSMGKGKMCAQCGHATLGAYIKAQKHCDTAILWWHRMGQAKVAVKVENDAALYELARMAQLKGLVTYIVEDAGRTQIAAGSKTVLAIGPAPVEAFESLTGHLKLL